MKNDWRRKFAQDDGWTFIEATMTIVLASVMILGLTITLLAFKEQLDRSWAIRTMDQYANDVVENISHDLRNATEVRVRAGAGNTSRVEIDFLDPMRKSDTKQTVLWRADNRTSRIWRGNEVLDRQFPASDLGPGETYQITQFTVSPFGTNNYYEPWARIDQSARNEQFMAATFDINLTLRYVRNAVGEKTSNWDFQKHYGNRVYTRNANLIVKKGITGAE